MESQNRESFASRIGFILVSAGCAIGIGNVWKFPYITGVNGGGVVRTFFLPYLPFDNGSADPYHGAGCGTCEPKICSACL